ncbi:hypothetical protein ACFV7R_25770 [Streptomyces sp. NPDC059866]|uniref:hypothetical protein n=1 Tax=Streptomyces sp. NPDC059866 TaxID=3346978 RepID=UPI00366685C5
MSPTATDIQSDRSWTEGVLAVPGTGRHRGRRADEDLCMPGIDSAGHGRHRRTARTPLLLPTAAFDVLSSEPVRQLVRN